MLHITYPDNYRNYKLILNIDSILKAIKNCNFNYEWAKSILEMCNKKTQPYLNNKGKVTEYGHSGAHCVSTAAPLYTAHQHGKDKHGMFLTLEQMVNYFYAALQTGEAKLVLQDLLNSTGIVSNRSIDISLASLRPFLDRKYSNQNFIVSGMTTGKVQISRVIIVCSCSNTHGFKGLHIQTFYPVE